MWRGKGREREGGREDGGGEEEWRRVRVTQRKANFIQIRQPHPSSLLRPSAGIGLIWLSVEGRRRRRLAKISRWDTLQIKSLLK